MALIVVIAFFWFVGKILSIDSAKRKEERRRAEIERIKHEQERQKEEAKAYQEEQKRIAIEQARQKKEQERLAKEQERQAAQLAKHEEMLMKLENKMRLLEKEMLFDEQHRGNIAELLNIAEMERDSLIKGSNEWQKAHKKVVSLENQYHIYDKRLQKAMNDYRLCKIQKSA